MDHGKICYPSLTLVTVWSSSTLSLGRGCRPPADDGFRSSLHRGLPRIRGTLPGIHYSRAITPRRILKHPPRMHSRGRPIPREVYLPGSYTSPRHLLPSGIPWNSFTQQSPLGNLLSPLIFSTGGASRVVSRIIGQGNPINGWKANAYRRLVTQRITPR